MEVWDSSAKMFVHYALAGQPKSVNWGYLVDEVEARRLMD